LVDRIDRFSNRSLFARAAAKAVADGLRSVLSRQENAVLAVPGGSTAREVLPALIEEDLPWRRVTVTLTDERWVPPPHGDSNETLVRTLCAGARAAVAGLYRPGLSPHAAARRLTQDHPRSDVILLGMGEDGHVASLFDATIRHADRFAATVGPKYERVTMTPIEFEGADKIVLAFFGQSKCQFFDAHASDPNVPVSMVLRMPAHVFMSARGLRRK
jgi:6-phosphogluconolactonase